MKLIMLQKGMVAQVDDEDYGYLSQFKWHAMKNGRNVYASRHIYRNGKRTTIQMHRELLTPPPGMQTDHADGNGLNNQKSNLRASTHSQNQGNSRDRINSSSGFKGVSWFDLCQKWSCHICHNRKKVFIGLFKEKIDAAIAYNEAAKKYFGEFARLNDVV